MFTSSKWKTEVPRITVFSQAVSFLAFCSSINSFCSNLWHAIYNTSCVIVHVPCYIVILANVINVAFVILLITKRKNLLSTDFLLLNVFITNMICAVGFCLPLYQYYLGNKKYSLWNCYIANAQFTLECDSYMTILWKSTKKQARICNYINHYIMVIWSPCGMIPFLKWFSN